MMGVPPAGSGHSPKGGAAKASPAKPSVPNAVTDPMERLIADALDGAGIAYATDLGGGNPSGLDFRLQNGVEIEVKRFHSSRIAEQMSRAPNVIAVQGEQAVAFFALLLAAYDHDNPPWTAEDFARARPASEALGPEIAAAMVRDAAKCQGYKCDERAVYCDACASEAYSSDE